MERPQFLQWGTFVSLYWLSGPNHLRYVGSHCHFPRLQVRVLNSDNHPLHPSLQAPRCALFSVFDFCPRNYHPSSYSGTILWFPLEPQQHSGSESTQLNHYSFACQVSHFLLSSNGFSGFYKCKGYLPEHCHFFLIKNNWSLNCPSKKQCTYMITIHGFAMSKYR